MRETKLLFLLSFFFLHISDFAYGADPLLEKKVSIQLSNETVSSALTKLSEKVSFDYSYNTQNLPSQRKINLSIQEAPLKEVLDKIIDDPSIQYKVQNNQIIFYKSSDSRTLKTEQTLSGTVKDSETGTPIAGVMIFDSWLGVSSVTDIAGRYSLKISNPSYTLSLVCRHPDYQEKSFKTKLNADKTLHVLLKKNVIRPDEAPEKISSISSTELLASVNQSDLTKFFIPEKVYEQENESNQLEKKMFQIGLVPPATTDSRMGGRYIHNASLNLIAGYSAGLEGVEVGGFANINRFNVNGLQIGGFANLNGGKTVGVQIGGFSNVTRLKTEGVQVAGFNNFSGLSLKGWQLSGFNNIVKGDLYGVQVAGFNNVTTEGGKGAQIAGFLNTIDDSFQGFQVSGFANYTKGDLQHFQVAGFANYLRGNTEGFQIAGFANTAKDVAGFQLAGFTNISMGNLEMFQVAGFANYLKGNSSGYQLSGFVNIADSVHGYQLAGFSNIAAGNLEGIQLSGFINVAGKVKGHQLGFINISDTIEQGMPIGFISYVDKGYNKLELVGMETGFINIQFKPGLKKFYNILSIGIFPDFDYFRWQGGYGLGTAFSTGKKSNINIDAIAFLTNESTKRQSSLSIRIAPSYSYNVWKKFDLFAGPSINWQIMSSLEEPQTSRRKISFQPIFSKNSSDDVVHNLWIGFQGGIRF